MKNLSDVNTWIFDLDNTLYPSSCRLFDQMHVRMSDFIIQEFGVDEAEAKRRRHHFYTKYGTTLRGLMVEHEMEPTAFLDFVHDIDYSAVAHSATLGEALKKLPGRKLVFTNGTLGHANRVLARLGCADQFEAIYDIVDSGYIPKPDARPYEDFLKVHHVDPQQSAFFEDLSENLLVPRSVGMKTVLIGKHDEALLPAHVDYVTDDLAEFLHGVSQ
jgi:putative hydrolase of the HAD superfamily